MLNFISKQVSFGDGLFFLRYVWFIGIGMEIGWEWRWITLPCGREIKISMRVRFSFHSNEFLFLFPFYETHEWERNWFFIFIFYSNIRNKPYGALEYENRKGDGDKSNTIIINFLFVLLFLISNPNSSYEWEMKWNFYSHSLF